MKQRVYRSILDNKIVAILRGLKHEENMNVIDVLIQSGITNLEVTLNTEGALEVISEARKKYNGAAYIGAGTVKNAVDAEKAVKAGAQFLIAPNLSEKAIEFANECNTLIVPGVFTPTEIVKACDLGCEIIKLFPAGVLGTAYIKQIKGPLDEVKIMAVGGVDVENVRDFIASGADAVGVGGQLIRSDLIRQGSFEELKAHFVSFLKSIR